MLYRAPFSDHNEWKAELVVLSSYLAISGPAARPLLHSRHGRMLAVAAAGLGLATAVQAVQLRRQHPTSRLCLIAAAALVSGAVIRSANIGAGRISADDWEGTLKAMSPSSGSPGWGTPRS